MKFRPVSFSFLFSDSSSSPEIPRIRIQPPTTVSINPGETARLECRAEVERGITYQWYNNEMELTNEQGPILEVHDSQADGYYWCLITNKLGYSTASDVCRLIVARLGVQPEPVVQPQPAPPSQDIEDMEGVQEGKESQFFCVDFNISSKGKV